MSILSSGQSSCILSPCLHSTYHHCRRHSCSPNLPLNLRSFKSCLFSSSVSRPISFAAGVEIVCITTDYFPGLGSALYVIHLTIRIDTLASLARSSSSLFHHDHLCLELFLQAFAQPFNPREPALQYLFAGARTRIEMLCPDLASSHCSRHF